MKHHGLVPELRTNKNGVTITRWVRRYPKPSEVAAFPPRPPTPTDGELGANGKDLLLKTIIPTAKLYGEKRERTLKSVEFLSGIVPDLLDRIAVACDSGGAEREEWMRLLGSVNYAPMERFEPGITRRGIERALTVFPYIGSLCGSSVDESIRSEYMDHYYEIATFLIEESGRREAPENETKAMVLACYIRGITPEMSWEQRGMESLYSEMKDDLGYLSSHLEEIEPFLDELVKRKEFSRGYVESVLATEARSLTSGVL